MITSEAPDPHCDKISWRMVYQPDVPTRIQIRDTLRDSDWHLYPRERETILPETARIQLWNRLLPE